MIKSMINPDHTIKRIIVSMDTGGVNPAAMESIVVLASRLQAELCGLFVEDTALLQLANLPFTREVTLLTALSRDLSGTSMEKNLSATAVQMQRTLERLAQLANVVCSFRTVRGPRLESVIRESNDFQVLVLMPKKRLTEGMRQVPKVDKDHPLVLFYDGSALAHNAAGIIRSLNTSSTMKQLLVLTTSDAAAEEIHQQFPSSHYHVRYEHIQGYDINELITLVRRQAPGLVILPLQDILLRQGAALGKLLDVLSCPLILVR